MRAAAPERVLIDGAAGAIEVAFDWPAGQAQGIVFIGHPHPLFGGTLNNKVVTTVGRTFASLGWIAARPNFRGVGASAGRHDEGNGETADFLHLISAAPALPEIQVILSATAPVAVAGFSFGSFIAAKTAAMLAGSGHAVQHLILIGVAAKKWPMPSVPPQTLAIHGELDETIPLAGVLDWARPQDLPVVVVPGADHFFHRRLGALKRLITAHIRGMPAIDAVAQTG